MCGLAGQYLYDASEEVDTALLERMKDRLQHRGPEAAGIWIDGNIGLSHVRLKLLDVHHGDQPMRGRRGSVLAYVGEIYNNAELRAELTVHGYPFQGTSDTEVLLAAFETWGERAWPRLNGMFAFALVDQTSRETFLVRDRLGIKPLYYRESDHGLEFSSEPVAWSSGAGRVSREALANFLCLAHTASDDESLYRGIKLLRPATQMRVARSGGEVDTWWRPQPAAMPENLDLPHLQARLRHLLHLAVGRQMVADAPVGALLSGGLDSTVLTTLMTHMQADRVRTYSVALQGDEEDLDAAREVARHLGTAHTELTVTPDEFFRAMDELTEIRRLPVALPNEVLIYLISRRASEEVKALLSGEGADELFGGYDRILDPIERYRRALTAQRDGDSVPLRALRTQWPDLDFSSLPSLFASACVWIPPDTVHSMMLDGHSPESRSQDPVRRVAERIAQSVSGLNEPAHAYAALLTHHLPHLLSRLDGSTMAASVEGRVPYTDSDLVDFALSLPPEVKYAPGKPTKPMLRNAFSDSLPPRIARRRKRAFHASPKILFESEQGRRRIRELQSSTALSRYFDMKQVNMLTDQDRGGRHYLRIWLLHSCHAWMMRNTL